MSRILVFKPCGPPGTNLQLLGLIGGHWRSLALIAAIGGFFCHKTHGKVGAMTTPYIWPCYTFFIGGRWGSMAAIHWRLHPPPSRGITRHTMRSRCSSSLRNSCSARSCSHLLPTTGRHSHSSTCSLPDFFGPYAAKCGKRRS